MVFLYVSGYINGLSVMRKTISKNHDVFTLACYTIKSFVCFFTCIPVSCAFLCFFTYCYTHAFLRHMLPCTHSYTDQKSWSCLYVAVSGWILVNWSLVHNIMVDTIEGMR